MTEALHEAVATWMVVAGEKAVLEAVASYLDTVSTSNSGKPVATMASINSNLIRQALRHMVTR